MKRMPTKLSAKELRRIERILRDANSKNVVRGLVTALFDFASGNQYAIQDFIRDWEATIELNNIPGLLERMRAIPRDFVEKSKPLPKGVTLSEYIRQASLEASTAPKRRLP